MEYWLLDIWHWIRQQKRLEPLVNFILEMKPDQRIRVVSYTTTGVLHIVVFAFISQYNIYLAPIYRIASGDGGIINVSLYTLSGIQAETDAPLNEPSLAEADDADGGDGGDSTQSGNAQSGDGSDNGDESGSDPEDANTDAPPADQPTPDEPAAEEAADTPAETPVDDPAIEPDVVTEPSEDTSILTAPGSDNEAVSPSQPPTRDSEDEYIPAPVIQRIRDPDLPIATTQVLPQSRVDRLGRPTYAEIEARADQRLNPADYVIQPGSLGLLQTVLDSFCLSSSAALLEIAECPEGPNPNQILLADYALSEFGEVPPVFMEDMDRLAFELEQLGADPGMIERMLVSYREALRTARSRDPVLRALERDEENQTDHLGVSNPFDGEREGPGGG